MKAALFVLLVISATAAFALKQSPNAGKIILPRFETASECSERPEFLTEARDGIVGTIDKLPAMGVLVARDAEYYVEGRTENGAPIRVHGYQSFLKTEANTQILCGESPKSLRERYSVFAPTLIDTTKTHEVGNSLWQFQIMADHDRYSTWNMKSPLSASNEKLDKLLNQGGTSYRLYQLGKKEYELMVIQEGQGVTQYLSVRYDAFSSVK